MKEKQDKRIRNKVEGFEKLGEIKVLRTYKSHWCRWLAMLFAASGSILEGKLYLPFSFPQKMLMIGWLFIFLTRKEIKLRGGSTLGWSCFRMSCVDMVVLPASGNNQGSIFNQKGKVTVTLTVKVNLSWTSGLCVLFFKLAVPVSQCLSVGDFGCMNPPGRWGAVTSEVVIFSTRHRGLCSLVTAFGFSVTCWSPLSLGPQPYECRR